MLLATLPQKNKRMYCHFYIDYLCRTCYSDEVCICEGCFQVHKHSNHQYVLIETEYTRICSCGNREIIAEPPTCEAHKLASFEEHMNNE